MAARWLNDQALSDTELARHVEHVVDSPFAGGRAMDTRENLYLSETATGRISIRSPDGQVAVLAFDPKLMRPDGALISRDRRLYIPVKTPLGGGEGNRAHNRPFIIYALSLPDSFDGIRLGNVITGSLDGQLDPTTEDATRPTKRP